MHDPTPTGRRIHALYAAHLPFSGAMDDVLDRLQEDGGPVVRRIAAVERPRRSASRPTSSCGSSSRSRSRTASRPCRRLYSPTCTGLRQLMQNVVLTDLEQHRRAAAIPHAGRHAAAGPAPTRDGTRTRFATRTPGSTRRTPRIARSWTTRSTPCAWCARPTPCASGARRCARRRGTRSSSTPTSGAAVFALRTVANDRLLLLRADSPLSAGEANLRCAFVTPHGNLRIAFHRGRFSSPDRGRRGVRRDRPRSSPTSAPTCSGRSPSGARRPICRAAGRERRRCGSSSSARPTSRRSPTRSPRRSPAAIRRSPRGSRSSPISRARHRPSGLAISAASRCPPAARRRPASCGRSAPAA